jgi:hypothetical protein
MEDLKGFVLEIRPSSKLEVKGDTIRINEYD